MGGGNQPAEFGTDAAPLQKKHRYMQLVFQRARQRLAASLNMLPCITPRESPQDCQEEPGTPFESKPPALQPAVQATAQSERELVTMAMSQEHSAWGLPYQVEFSGLPKPPCQDARVANLAEIKRQMKLSERPEMANIMQLICHVFSTESALVALLDDEDLFVQDSTKIPRGHFPWRRSFCVATLSPASHQTFVCENAKEDIRFAGNELVRAGLVNFYVGSPLVSSAGHRIGTLCFTDSKPRNFDAESCQLMNNLAEMVARELERDWVRAVIEERQRQESKESSGSAPQTPMELLRNMEDFEEAVLFVDVSPPTWTVLMANSAAAGRLGAPSQEFAGMELWNMLETEDPADSQLAHMYHAGSISHGHNFCIPGVKLPSHGELGTSSGAAASSKDTTYVLNFRSAGKDLLAVGDTIVGVPASVPWTGVRNRYYFATLARQESPAASPRHTAGLNNVPFDELEIGPVLGKGGFGSVYRGLWHGKQVAIKVIKEASTVVMKGTAPLEAVISKHITHPGIVKVYDYAVHPGEPVWMLTELCDCGTLQDACNKGVFRDNLEVLVGTALQIAEAVQVLHMQNIIHGDLSGGNVLLTSAPTALGWQAKISDFGLAREHAAQSSMIASRYGSVTHMPPELLQFGRLSKAADVYAFGVLLWSMYHCSLPWASLNHAQVIAAKLKQQALRWDPKAPVPLVELGVACLSDQSEARPTPPAIRRALAALLTDPVSLPPSEQPAALSQQQQPAG